MRTIAKTKPITVAQNTCCKTAWTGLCMILTKCSSPNIAEEISDVNINLKRLFWKRFKMPEKNNLRTKNSSNLPANNATSREGRKSPNPPDKTP